METPAVTDAPVLRRSLSLTLMTLYGVGTTIGAGIYVLVGKVAGAAGLLAPVSFLVAAALAAFSALSFAELASRYPYSAGEAVYVREGTGLRWLSTTVGLFVALSGIVSAATISIGFAGYFNTLVAAPAPLVITCVVLCLGLIAAWGIREAVALAAVLTILEVAGLVFIIWIGRDVFGDIPSVISSAPALPGGAIAAGIASGVVLAFFAFIGFEDMVNVAEEIRDVDRTLPRAVILTLVITTIIYLAVMLVIAFGLPPAVSGASEAPLALFYTTTTGRSPELITLISLVAVVNGALVQTIMASRVLYGLAKQGQFFRAFAAVHPVTRTPVYATAAVVVLVLLFALALPIETVARLTSLIVLVVFALVNLSLLRLKLRADTIPHAEMTVPAWVPAIGLVASAFFAAYQLVEFLL